jgi:hypothetical protein
MTVLLQQVTMMRSTVYTMYLSGTATVKLKQERVGLRVLLYIHTCSHLLVLSRSVLLNQLPHTFTCV